MDWSSFAFGFLASYLISFIALVIMLRGASKAANKKKEYTPVYQNFDKTSGTASMGWDNEDYY